MRASGAAPPPLARAAVPVRPAGGAHGTGPYSAPEREDGAPAGEPGEPGAPGAPGAPALGRVLRGMVWSALAALAAAVLLGLWSDWQGLAGAFGRFDWVALPVALVLTLVNAGLRFGKWHYYVRRIGARPSMVDSALIFVSGFALSITPGKSGELLKAVLLSRRCGAPAWRAAPISLAERATDGFAVLVLAGAGLTVVWRSPLPLLLCAVAAVAGCGTLALIGVATRPGGGAPAGPLRLPGAPRGPHPGRASGASDPGRGGNGGWLRRLAGRPRIEALLARLRQSGEGAAAILDPVSLAVAVGLGVVSWGAESVALWYALVAFGLAPSLDLFGTALVALNAGTLAGAVSLLPGGAGAAEATIAGVLAQQTTRQVAAAATLLIRLCTVWFGALLGIGALLALRDCFSPRPLAPGSSPA